MLFLAIRVQSSVPITSIFPFYPLADFGVSNCVSLAASSSKDCIQLLFLSQYYFVLSMSPALKYVEWSMIWMYHTPGLDSYRITAGFMRLRGQEQTCKKALAWCCCSSHMCHSPVLFVFKQQYIVFLYFLRCEWPAVIVRQLDHQTIYGASVELYVSVVY